MGDEPTLSSCALSHRPRLIEVRIVAKQLELIAVNANFVEQIQAGEFRQRREGLAYRLSFARLSIEPPKRMEPNSTNLIRRPKIVYRTRSAISKWSQRELAGRKDGHRTLHQMGPSGGDSPRGSLGRKVDSVSCSTSSDWNETRSSVPAGAHCAL
jgi:hypothetical protein